MKYKIIEAINAEVDLKETIREFLVFYRSVPHSENAISPFEYLSGSKMKTLVSKFYKGELPKKELSVKKIIYNKQKKIKLTNEKREGASKRFEIDDWVYVKLSNGEKSKPMKILQNYRTFAILSDNKKWTHNRLMRLNPERGNVG